MTKKQLEKGFSTVEVLIVIAVVAILAAASFFMWQKSKKDDTTKQPAATSQQSAKQDSSGKTDDTDATTDPTEGGKYLYIKEWGVQFQLPEGLRGDISYHLFDPDNAQYDPTSSDVVRLISAKYADVPGCDMTSSGGYLGLSREDPDVSQQIVPAKFKQVGKYNFFFTGTSCSEGADFKGQIADDYVQLKQSIVDTLVAY